MINQEPLGAIIWGIIANENLNIEMVEQELTTNFGKIIHRSPIIPFDYTNYYEEEMGKHLYRLWVMTENLVPLSKMAQIKNFARKLENKYRNEKSQRLVNIDPGFITLSNFVLLTTKNYAHRIYLGSEIFAEVTLIYRNHSFQSLAWTYPDYKNAIEYFNQARTIYKQLLQKLK